MFSAVSAAAHVAHSPQAAPPDTAATPVDISQLSVSVASDDVSEEGLEAAHAAMKAAEKDLKRYRLEKAEYDRLSYQDKANVIERCAYNSLRILKMMFYFHVAIR